MFKRRKRRRVIEKQSKKGLGKIKKGKLGEKELRQTVKKSD